jgi:hypothetical protein
MTDPRTTSEHWSREHFDNAVKLRTMLLGRLVTSAIVAAARLGIPDLLADASHTIGEIAKVAESDPSKLRQLLRALVALELVTEDSVDTFGLTTLGQALRSGVPGSAYPSALLAGGEIGKAWDGLTEVVQTGRSAFCEAFGGDFFSYLADRPELSGTFYDSQAADLDITLAELASVDFAAYKTVVDVGGGDGALLAHILTRYPAVHGVLLDHGPAVAAARLRMAAAGVDGRYTAVAGDFFSDVPTDGDLYIMRDVLHDWQDDRCLDLLRVCRRAMPDGATLIVIERTSGEPVHQHTALMDLYMLSVLASQERTLAEYHKLLRVAGFQPGPTRELAGGATLIEALV